MMVTGRLSSIFENVTQLKYQWRSARSILNSSRQPKKHYSYLCISKKVQDALDQRRPIVCLESTIITHGMDYPANLRMARSVEKVIEEGGAVPATIAILNGIAHVGLEDDDLQFLARTGKQARKVSRRDMAACQADAATGGTTVSGTMILAKKAGIKVFVTGGIGGVHRGAELTMDVSNDLNELSKNDVAVVCAGPKAILDIPLTLEYLETMGVTVTTIGQQNLPAFYSRDSGLKSPQVSPTIEHAAELISANQQLQLGSSVLVCVPIPEEASIDANEMRTVIDTALKEAHSQNVAGKDTTPFLLSAVSNATKGRSLEANISLVMENARVGAQIAVHLAQLECALAEDQLAPTTRISSTESSDQLDTIQSQDVAKSLQELEDGISLQDDLFTSSLRIRESNASTSSPRTVEPAILVIGGVAVDIACNIACPLADLEAVLYTSTAGTVTRSLGGVAGNIARAAAITGSAVTLSSVIGSVAKDLAGQHTIDADGQYILDSLTSSGVTLRIESIPKARSATYTVVQLKGELLVAVADMNIFEEERANFKSEIASHNYNAVIFDANIPDVVSAIAKNGCSADIVCFEPTSVSKAGRFFDATSNHRDQSVWPLNTVTLMTPNIYELKSMFDTARNTGQFEQTRWWEVINALDIAAEFRGKLEHFVRKHQSIKINLEQAGIVQQAIHLLPFFENIYLTLGSSGIVSFHLRSTKDIQLEHQADVLTQQGQDCVLYICYHYSLEVPALINDTGAGDTFTGVLVSALTRGQSVHESVRVAQQAAVMTLGSTESVAPNLKSLFE